MGEAAPSPPVLAINGGPPVRREMLPYARHEISEEDVEAVAAALRSDWLTTGPRVEEFESAFARAVSAEHAVAVNSGTAALHAAVFAADLGLEDEVLVPALTFVATANAVLYEHAVPVFADVDPETLLVDPKSLEARITGRTRALIAVDYAGQPCDYRALRALADRRKLVLISDACHSLGATDADRSVGTLAELNCFSFHPAKAVTAGEGGMITTANPEYAKRMRGFRNHGFDTDFRRRAADGAVASSMTERGWNYRLTDFQCALGSSQLRRMPERLEQRRRLALRYGQAFASWTNAPAPRPLVIRPGINPAWHLYVVRLPLEQLTVGRDRIFAALRAEGIGVAVHYPPVHLQPYYRRTFGFSPGLCPVAEAAYERLLTLPLFPGMSDSDQDDVLAALRKVLRAYAR